MYNLLFYISRHLSYSHSTCSSTSLLLPNVRSVLSSSLSLPIPISLLHHTSANIHDIPESILPTHTFIPPHGAVGTAIILRSTHSSALYPLHSTSKDLHPFYWTTTFYSLCPHPVIIRGPAHLSVVYSSVDFRVSHGFGQKIAHCSSKRIHATSQRVRYFYFGYRISRFIGARHING